MSAPTPARRVAAGVALLDQRGPVGWRRQVDPVVLDVGSLVACPLAQLYGSYTEGCLALGLADSPLMTDAEVDATVAHGFESRQDVWGSEGPDYAALTEAWRAALTPCAGAGQMYRVTVREDREPACPVCLTAWSDLGSSRRPNVPGSRVPLHYPGGGR